MPPWPDVKAKTIFFINIQFGKFEITEDLETGDVLANNPINHDVM